jgi:hypothetical protein
VKWSIQVGAKSVIPAKSAADIVCARLEYIAGNPRCNQQRLLGEALDYARLVRQWIRDNEPRVERAADDMTQEYTGARPGGKPGPMSDG